MIRKLAPINFVTNDLEPIIDPDGNAIELMEYGSSSMQLSG